MNKTSKDQYFILTFGYGNRVNYDTLLDYIKEFKIDFLIDVREKPRAWSRKWYGDQLEKFCHEQGIEYLSETTLGNVSGTSHWVSPDPKKAEQVLQDIAQKTQSKTVLLLCAEMDHHRCHRVEVAEKLQELIHLPIKHLE
ncbi:protein of unknown function DUF1130 [Gloeothece citriformis PCC 7424]|uniref:DUF488 domain-containing protein n=1 Tax=Gloeothece citriformis (strain PCC 7424) TaxID=65393 RepID=B7KE43_GLOC7|nr:DUF488 domain-containing protein [Gloeothece citriformis]ACK71741.1 protein of unknown function DUF1130 [Gloeothece citriformis PCC 7424]